MSLNKISNLEQSADECRDEDADEVCLAVMRSLLNMMATVFVIEAKVHRAQEIDIMRRRPQVRNPNSMSFLAESGFEGVPNEAISDQSRRIMDIIFTIMDFNFAGPSVSGLIPEQGDVRLDAYGIVKRSSKMHQMLCCELKILADLLK